MRTESTSASRNAESAQEPHDRKGERKPADAQSIERFRAVLAQVQGQDPHAQQRSGGLLEESPLDRAGDRLTASAMQSSVMADAGWVPQLQRAHLEAAAAPPPTRAPNTAAATLADLIERHVRQLAVGESDAVGGTPVLLRLADDVLPDTDLLLTRNEQGWQLRVESGRADSARQVERGARELVERFAQRHLGALSVDVVQRPDP